MKLKSKCLAVTVTLAVLSTINCQLSTLHAQGALTPPGAPAPTMKSLAQIEPRIPISSTPYFIFTPGSYYLTTNLTVNNSGAIAITANDVTLDLNGFTISSTASPAFSAAILLSGTPANIFIYNGHIKSGVTNNAGVFSGPGFVNGIGMSGTVAQNIHVNEVSVVGCLQYGIYLGTSGSTVVESCSVKTAGITGIYASTVSLCSAADCGSYGISASSVSDCQGLGYGNANGILANNANNCLGYSDAGVGINTSSANNCVGSGYGSGTGIAATTAFNCEGLTDTGKGLNVQSAVNCYGFAYGNGKMIVAQTATGCSGLGGGNGIGLDVGNGMAYGCYMKNDTAGGISLRAKIANSCKVDGGSLSVTNKYNMP